MEKGISTVFGMPVNIPLPEGYTISPLSALVVMKGMDSNGDIVHTVAYTEDLTLADVLGYAHFAVIHAEENIKVVMHGDPEGS